MEAKARNVALDPATASRPSNYPGHGCIVPLVSIFFFPRKFVIICKLHGEKEITHKSGAIRPYI